VSDQTFYRWKKVYGGLAPSEARELKQLADENTKPKRVVADYSARRYGRRRSPIKPSLPDARVESHRECPRRRNPKTVEKRRSYPKSQIQRNWRHAKRLEDASRNPKESEKPDARLPASQPNFAPREIPEQFDRSSSNVAGECHLRVSSRSENRELRAAGSRIP
jgi:hypothetical protein